MSVITVARKDFADARRSKALLALAGLFVVMGVGGTYLYTILPTMDPSIGPVTPEGLYGFLGQISALFVAISALVLNATGGGGGPVGDANAERLRDIFDARVVQATVGDR